MDRGERFVQGMRENPPLLSSDSRGFFLGSWESRNGSSGNLTAFPAPRLPSHPQEDRTVLACWLAGTGVSTAPLGESLPFGPTESSPASDRPSTRQFHVIPLSHPLPTHQGGNLQRGPNDPQTRLWDAGGNRSTRRPRG